jgi:hypothetical protein
MRSASTAASSQSRSVAAGVMSMLRTTWSRLSSRASVWREADDLLHAFGNRRRIGHAAFDVGTVGARAASWR